MTFGAAPSLATSNVVAFAATTDADKARAFYGDALGLRLVSEDPRDDAAGGSRVAWFKDPDGNLLSLTQFADE